MGPFNIDPFYRFGKFHRKIIFHPQNNNPLAERFRGYNDQFFIELRSYAPDGKILSSDDFETTAIFTAKRGIYAQKKILALSTPGEISFYILAEEMHFYLDLKILLPLTEVESLAHTYGVL